MRLWTRAPRMSMDSSKGCFGDRICVHEQIIHICSNPVCRAGSFKFRLDSNSTKSTDLSPTTNERIDDAHTGVREIGTVSRDDCQIVY